MNLDFDAHFNAEPEYQYVIRSYYIVYNYPAYSGPVIQNMRGYVCCVIDTVYIIALMETTFNTSLYSLYSVVYGEETHGRTNQTSIYTRSSQPKS